MEINQFLFGSSRDERSLRYDGSIHASIIYLVRELGGILTPNQNYAIQQESVKRRTDLNILKACCEIAHLDVQPFKAETAASLMSESIMLLPIRNNHGEPEFAIYTGSDGASYQLTTAIGALSFKEHELNAVWIGNIAISVRPNEHFVYKRHYLELQKEVLLDSIRYIKTSLITLSILSLLLAFNLMAPLCDVWPGKISLSVGSIVISMILLVTFWSCKSLHSHFATLIVEAVSETIDITRDGRPSLIINEKMRDVKALLRRIFAGSILLFLGPPIILSWVTSLYLQNNNPTMLTLWFLVIFFVIIRIPLSYASISNKRNHYLVDKGDILTKALTFDVQEFPTLFQRRSEYILTQMKRTNIVEIRLVWETIQKNIIAIILLFAAIPCLPIPAHSSAELNMHSVVILSLLLPMILIFALSNSFSAVKDGNELITDIANLKISPKKRIISSVSSIEFKNVYFGLKKSVELNFTLKRGYIHKIIGQNGSGKTALISVLTGNNIYVDGKLFINGVLENFGQAHLKTFCLGPSSRLIEGTILENIILGDPNPDFNKISQFCSLYKFDIILRELPTGLATYLAKNGLNIPYGYSCIILLARAIYFEPELLILDNPFSPLDKRFTKFISDTLMQIKNQMIVVEAEMDVGERLSDYKYIYL